MMRARERNVPNAGWLVAVGLALTAWAGEGMAEQNAGRQPYLLKTRLLFAQPNATAAPSLVSDAEIAGLGGTVDLRTTNRVIVRLPEAAAEALRHHPAVKYLQRGVKGSAPVRMPSGNASAAQRDSLAMATTGLRPVTEAVWNSGAYGYDSAGNVKQIGANTYTYDAVSRLKSTTAGSNVEAYRYDAFGNLIERVTNGVSYPVGVDANNRLTGGVYDGAGNLSGSGVQTYLYDPFNRMREKYDASATELYVYTASDERIGVRQGELWTWSFRDEAGRVLRQYDSVTPGQQNPLPTMWGWVEDYVYREGLLAGTERVAEEGGRRHVHLDHLGTPRLITGTGGLKVTEHEYYPFGNEITAWQGLQRGFDREEPRKFTGHERDFTGGTTLPNTNYLDYMHARYYNPSVGRFLSVDPVIDFKTNLRNPQGWNRYAYVMNNPMRWTDPTGKIIEYDDEFRKRAKNDAEFRRAFEGWKQTKSGAAMWRAMGRDTNTVYRFGVGKVTAMVGVLKQAEVRGRTLPIVGARHENRAGNLDVSNVSMMINADWIKSTHRLRPEMISSEIAKTIFHEGLHGLDIGSGTRSASQAWRAEDLLGDGVEPRMKLFERELNQILPPPDLD